MKSRNSDTPSAWVRRTHRHRVQKWRRVAFATALSQGGIRENRSASLVPNRQFDRFLPHQLLDAETHSDRRMAGRNFRHRRDSPLVRRSCFVGTVPELAASHSRGAAITVELTRGREACAAILSPTPRDTFYIFYQSRRGRDRCVPPCRRHDGPVAWTPVPPRDSR